MSLKHPFVLLARPHTMAELRKMGYKTFSPMIDESYDSIIDDTERFNAIWAEITRLSQQTTEEWINWQSQIKEIVDYNHTHFYENVNHT
jgi:gas vesicle protein